MSLVKIAQKIVAEELWEVANRNIGMILKKEFPSMKIVPQRKDNSTVFKVGDYGTVLIKNEKQPVKKNLSMEGLGQEGHKTNLRPKIEDVLKRRMAKKVVGVANSSLLFKQVRIAGWAKIQKDGNKLFVVVDGKKYGPDDEYNGYLMGDEVANSGMVDELPFSINDAIKFLKQSKKFGKSWIETLEKWQNMREGLRMSRWYGRG